MGNDVNTMILFFLSLMIACPVIAQFIHCVFVDRPVLAARCAGYSIGMGFLIGVGLLACSSLLKSPTIYFLIGFNTLSLLLCSFVLLVSFVVHRFSLRYMHGDRLYRRFFILLSGLTFSALIMVLADNLFLFWGSWSFSNLFLVLLMAHKREWTAAKNSSVLAFYTLVSGSFCLLIAFSVLSLSCSTTSIEGLIQQPHWNHLPILSLCLILIVFAALIQSGLFPFHRWLISSLNSPTPVSALMHAGLVNGGGILIVKFAPLMILCQGMLTLLFLFGAFSALMGTTWKLMQHDIKKMLACSTLAQMGFMMMQCGAGLFAAAIAHLCWHGLFKAHLFLSSGSALAQNKSDIKPSEPALIFLLVSLLGGVAAMISFIVITNKTISFFEASSFILFFAFIAGAQLMLTWVCHHKTFAGLVIGVLLAFLSGLMYGVSVHLIEWFIPSVSTIQAPQLSLTHWSVMILFGLLWFVFNLGLHRQFGQSRFGCWLYMNLFNASQPSAKTITALRTDYNY